MKNKNRYALYLRDKDDDIKNFIKPLLHRYDFSSIVRELIRDGIKYRQGMLNKNVERSSTPSPIERIDLKKAEVNEDKLEQLFDDL